MTNRQANVGLVAHAASVHLDLALPNFGIQEMVSFPDVGRQVIPGGLAFQEGYMNVEDSPGLGTDMNEELARKYPYRRSDLPLGRGNVEAFTRGEGGLCREA